MFETVVLGERLRQFGEVFRKSCRFENVAIVTVEHGIAKLLAAFMDAEDADAANNVLI